MAAYDFEFGIACAEAKAMSLATKIMLEWLDWTKRVLLKLFGLVCQRVYRHV